MTEAFACLDAGAHAIKFFPADTLDPKVLKAHRAVLPSGAKVVVVGGIGPENMAAWREAGADAFGAASNLYQPGQSADETGRRARDYVRAVLQGAHDLKNMTLYC